MPTLIERVRNLRNLLLNPFADNNDAEFIKKVRTLKPSSVDIECYIGVSKFTDEIIGWDWSVSNEASMYQKMIGSPATKVYVWITNYQDKPLYKWAENDLGYSLCSEEEKNKVLPKILLMQELTGNYAPYHARPNVGGEQDN